MLSGVYDIESHDDDADHGSDNHHGDGADMDSPPVLALIIVDESC